MNFLINCLLKIGENKMTRKDKEQIYKAINNVSNKVNDVSQKLDEVIQAVNKLTNERIDASGTAIDDIANMIAVHNEAIDSLAEMTATESEE